MPSRTPFPLHPLALAVAMAVGPCGAVAATITVTDGGDDNSQTTTCTLRQAIESANQNATDTACASGAAGADTIVFDPSLIGATITISGSVLAISEPLTIVGTGQTIQASGNIRVLSVVPGASLDLSTVTISGGNTSAKGAGINVSQATLNLEYVSVYGNTSSGDAGGGIYAYNSTLHLTETTLSGNSAHLSGGGLVATHGSSVTLDHCGFSGNTADIGAAAAVSSGAQLTLNQSTVTNNAAVSAGGGLAALQDGSITVNGGNVINNSAGNNGGGLYAYANQSLSASGLNLAGNSASYGGGAWLDNFATLTLLHSTISGNSAAQFGGGFGGFYHSALTITDSTINGNSASGLSGGGGIEMHGYGTVTLVNSTLANNTAVVGGGAALYQSDIDLIDSTVTGNSASGGGMKLEGFSSATLANTILSGNTAPNQLSDYFNAVIDGSSTISAYFCVLGTGPALAAPPNNDPQHYNHFTNSPLLGSLAANGGPTQTIAPLDGSPALDNGSIALALSADSNALNYDQRGRGFPRTLSGKVDIGAFQHQDNRIFADGLDPEP